MMQEETAKSTDPYLCLEPGDPRRKLTDRQSIDSKTDLNQWYLSKEQEVYNLFIKYGEAFSFRDEISICPNIEVDLQVINKSPLFIGTFHVKEEYKSMIDREM